MRSVVHIACQYFVQSALKKSIKLDFSLYDVVFIETFRIRIFLATDRPPALNFIQLRQVVSGMKIRWTDIIISSFYTLQR